MKINFIDKSDQKYSTLGNIFVYRKENVGWWRNVSDPSIFYYVHNDERRIPIFFNTLLNECGSLIATTIPNGIVHIQKVSGNMNIILEHSNAS